MNPSLTIILPTFNEAENILVLIHKILDLNLPLDFKICVVDDDSPDGTGKLISEKFAGNPQVTLIDRKGKDRGLVNSLNDGLQAASSNYVLWMDADLQMRAEKLQDFCDIILKEKPLAVVGSRFLKGGADIRDKRPDSFVPEVHKNMSWLLSQLVPFMLGLRCTDITSGFISVRRDFFNQYKLTGKHGEYFIDLMFHLEKTGEKIIETPYRLLPRSKGESKSTGGSLVGLFITGLNYLNATMVVLRKKLG